jgi:hypothetical protein
MPRVDGNNAFKKIRSLGKKECVLFGIILVFSFCTFLINSCSGVRICLCGTGLPTGPLSVPQMIH